VRSKLIRFLYSFVYRGAAPRPFVRRKPRRGPVRDDRLPFIVELSAEASRPHRQVNVRRWDESDLKAQGSPVTLKRKKSLSFDSPAESPAQRLLISPSVANPSARLYQPPRDQFRNDLNEKRHANNMPHLWGARPVMLVPLNCRYLKSVYLFTSLRVL
jgi:hypothetical protein